MFELLPLKHKQVSGRALTMIDFGLSVASWRVLLLLAVAFYRHLDTLCCFPYIWLTPFGRHWT